MILVNVREKVEITEQLHIAVMHCGVCVKCKPHQKRLICTVPSKCHFNGFSITNDSNLPGNEGLLKSHYSIITEQFDTLESLATLY